MNLELRLIELLSEVIKVTQQLTAAVKPAEARPHGPSNCSTGHRGIFKQQSKYNPYRVYVWDKGLQKTVSLGVHTSIAKAKKAQKEYTNGKQVRAGNGRVFQIVKAA
ncbi:MAG: hypothetical protein WCS37_20960 [Chloroflexota bacterium]